MFFVKPELTGMVTKFLATKSQLTDISLTENPMQGFGHFYYWQESGFVLITEIVPKNSVSNSIFYFC
jgi:hypothetical protein